MEGAGGAGNLGGAVKKDAWRGNLGREERTGEVWSSPSMSKAKAKLGRAGLEVSGVFCRGLEQVKENFADWRCEESDNGRRRAGRRRFGRDMVEGIWGEVWEESSRSREGGAVNAHYMTTGVDMRNAHE